jgi:hypothetical protein
MTHSRVAGSRRRAHKKTHRRKSRRGGYLGSVLKQAAVPMTLMALNHKMGKRSHKRGGSKKHHKKSGHKSRKHRRSRRAGRI